MSLMYAEAKKLTNSRNCHLRATKRHLIVSLSQLRAKTTQMKMMSIAMITISEVYSTFPLVSSVPFIKFPRNFQ